MNDGNDNVTFLNPKKKAEDPNPDKESLSYFLEGIDEYSSYQDAERAGKAVMAGITKVCTVKFGIKDHESFYADAAVVSVLVYGMFLRQRGLDTPETFMLTDIRRALDATLNDGNET
jgi:hypothetical protein